MPGLLAVNSQLDGTFALPYRNPRVTITAKPYVIATGATDDRAVSVTYHQT